MHMLGGLADMQGEDVGLRSLDRPRGSAGLFGVGPGGNAVHAILRSLEMIAHRGLGRGRIMRDQRFDDALMFGGGLLRRIGAIERAEYLEMRVQPLDRCGDQMIAAASRDQAMELGVGLGKAREGAIVPVGDAAHVLLDPL